MKTATPFQFCGSLMRNTTWSAITLEKTVIRSRAALYYGDAQRMIDDVNDKSEIAVSLRHLMDISRHFKAMREKDGALFLASQEFKFKVENDHVNPTDMQVYQTFEANSMIEEWMLFANAAAARKVYESYPRWTLLRRHQRPAENAFDNLNEALERKLGLRLDDTTSLTLNTSLNACIDPDDAYFNQLIRILVTRCLRQAQYFSSSEVSQDEFYHFGLAMPIYTHFTSPIRRYADVIVHRQLAAALGIMQVSEKHTDSVKMEAVAANINYRHEQAQRAGRDSQNLFTGFYLRNFAGQVIPDEDGYVVKLSETHVFVLVPKYGQEGKIPKEQLVRVPGLLDKVRVGIELRQQGDVLRTTLAFVLVGMMKEGEDGRGEFCTDGENGEKPATDDAAGEEGPVRKKFRRKQGRG
ncbi:putative rrp44p [Trypanosoma cruzi]|uniref:Putative rrp44p n=1 Tax=Trypanosoma cruzi TaxID=5693 RepID=A0A2V2VWG2_TRYCR|nr:putative rrp44p [Trypanosoma cruzi]